MFVCSLQNGAMIPNRSAVTGLKVFVLRQEVRLPAQEWQFPEYAHDVVPVLEITTKRGGRGGRGEGTGWTARDLLLAREEAWSDGGLGLGRIAARL
jgi:hypothetical protein